MSTAAVLDTTSIRSPRLARSGEHDVALGDDRAPLARDCRAMPRRQRPFEASRDVTAYSSPAWKKNDDCASTPLIDLAPLAGRRVEQVGVDPAPADQHARPAGTDRRRWPDVGPRLGGRQVVEHDRIVGRVGPEPMEADVPVVRVARRVAQVPEPRVVGQPGDRRGPGVGDRVGTAAAPVRRRSPTGRSARCRPR